MLAVVLLGVASGQAAPDAPGRLPTAPRMTVDPKQGIVTLGMVRVPDWKVGTFALATDPRRLERWWRALDFPDLPPPIDFTRHRVVFFVEAPLCDRAIEPAPYRGRGGLPLVALHIFSGRRIVPEFAPVARITCTDHLELGPATGFAYAVRVPRTVVSAKTHVALGPAPASLPPPDSTPCVGCVRPSHPVGDSREHDLGPVEDGVPLPDRGEARVAHWRDGTPVWVVRHFDGTVTVLGATRAVAPERAPGLDAVVTWDPSRRTFWGAFDEHGRPLSGWGPGLERHPSRTTEGRVFVERRATVVPAGRPDPIRVPRPDELAPTDQPFRGVADGTLPGGKLAARDGTYRVSGTLRVDPSGPATLCVVPRPGAEEHCIVIEGVTVRADCRVLTRGAFVVQRRQATWHLVSAVGGDYGITCTAPAGERVWPSRRGFPRVGRPSFAAHAGGLVSSRRSGPSVGGEVGLARRWPLGGHPFVDTSQLRGQVLALSARARVLDAPTAASHAEWQIGLQSSLYNTNQLSRHLNLPSPLGLVLPELGVAGGSGRASPYASWRLGASWVLRPGYWRQRPYGIRERVAVDITPILTARLDSSSPTWRVGATAGITVW